MTPRSKAIYLIMKFKSSESEDGFNDVRDLHAANRCAMIAVDEILEMIDETDDLIYYRSKFNFWMKVKNELKKYDT
jgi:hypothetical protein